MAGIPITREMVSEVKAEAIRAAVRGAQSLPSGTSTSRLAQPGDAAELLAFLSDPAIHAPIYSLPQPLNLETVTAWIEQHLKERDAGEGLLFLRMDGEQQIAGYSDLQIWPQWAAAELGGAIRPDMQNRGAGGAGAKTMFDWMFEKLGLELICETAALDNIRTAKLLDHLGFKRMGEIQSTRADGTTRPSLVWEVTRGDWFG